MPGCNKPPRNNQPKIRYCWNAAERCSFEFGGADRDEYVTTFSNHSKACNTTSEPELTGVITTAELISSVSKIWDCATRLSIFQPNALSKRSYCSNVIEDVFVGLSKEETRTETHSPGGKCFPIRLSAGAPFSTVAQQSIGFVKIAEKLPFLTSDHQNPTYPFLGRLLHGETHPPSESCRREGLSDVGVLCKLGGRDDWMKDIFPTVVEKTDIKRTGNNCSLGGKGDGEVATDGNNLVNGLCTRDEGSTASIQSCDSSTSNCTGVVSIRGSTSVSSEDLPGAVEDCIAEISVPKASVSSLCADYLGSHLNNYETTCKGSEYRNYGDYLLKIKEETPQTTYITNGECKRGTEIESSEKPCSTLSKQEHALSGALAGISVSVCLHPVDTVKTLVQACHAEQKSVLDIGKFIISERGISGLYRGITSNISMSAPISALYTFTYESVKGCLLPLLPQEYQSLVHCVAGGCASVATSFIFTPSEHVKQQMQVGTCYNNCWNALVGIIQKGGFQSLYAGWAAVLCRNVPHSIIKFYMYENLKKKVATTSQPNSLHMLLCGGLAGSTAALFSTPFDVVKTRLQTQMPGSESKYNSVFHAIQDIRKYEGLKGLYRGLVPRLVMYMSQGALFFASYEFFKKLLALEASQFPSPGVQMSSEGDL